jgi:hypothetical protein
MKTKLLGFLAFTLSASFIGCNNDGDNNTSATADTPATTTSSGTGDATDNSTTTTATSTNDYAALSDTLRVNSEAGNYLNPRTGKAIKLRLDTTTGTRLDATTGEPIWRYVDKRTYKVYSSDDVNSKWDTVGTARMQNNRLEYRGDNEDWVSYDKRWRSEDERRSKDWKTKIGDTKIKVSKDGDVKVTDESGKVKYDADDNKLKIDTTD